MAGKEVRNGEAAKLRDTVVSNLRACLLSTKTGVSIRELDSDYKKIVGENIPYRKLGFATLNDFLSKTPGINISYRGSEMIIVARPTQDSVHITNMIARQKSAPRKRSRDTVRKYRRPTLGAPRPAFMYQRARRVPEPQRSTQNNGNNRSQMPNVVPLMSTQQKKPISSMFEKPRYMLKSSGSQGSPSKRLMDRKSTSPLSRSSSIPPLMDTPPTPLMSVVTQFGQPGFKTSDPCAKQPSARRNLSERLSIKMPSHQTSDLITPLSPGQLIANTTNTQIVTPPRTPDIAERVNLGRQISADNSQSQNSRTQLQMLVERLHLPIPVYKTLPRQLKRQAPVYACQVKVGPESYNSYPEERLTIEEAQELAAAKAVKEINQKYGLLSRFSATNDKSLVKQRIIAVVSQHNHGVFMHQIPAYYKEQYKENLPEEWYKIVEECSGIIKDKGADNSTILLPYSAHKERMDGVISPKLEKIRLSPIGPAVPGILIPPEDQYWDVYITCFMSTVDISARLIGEDYSDKYDLMTIDFEAHYNAIANTHESSGVQVGNYYAVRDDESWHRVQCLEFDASTGETRVFFIDLGEEDLFDHKKLFPLDKKFCRLPAQALNISLADLEEFSDCYDILEECEELLLGKSLVAQVVSCDTDDEESMASVILYDTREQTEINLNKKLFEIISQNVLKPILSQDGRITEVYVSHVTETGDVFLQVKCESMRYLANLMNKLLETALTVEYQTRSSVTTIDTTKIYLTRCFEDGNWYRGIVVDICVNNQLKMHLVDFGKTIIVSRKHLLLLDPLSEVLANYPHQALKVRLHNTSESVFSNRMAVRLAELAPPGEQLLAKVVTPERDGKPATVELFKRFQPDNVLVSINNTVLLDPELTGFGDGNNNTKPRKRVERTTSRVMNDKDAAANKLIPPKIPDFGSYFDVHVTMAAHPGNFTVQPYDQRVQMEAMMVHLQEVCVGYSGPALTSETIQEGSLFAAKHIDGHWYRVCISKMINEHMITVYFCDFGDVSVLTLDKLQPLGKQFLTLPYQAIKARLVGIQPVNLDWSVQDCLRFQELVVEGNFVSIVVESALDTLSPADTVLGLNLIDVSGNEDIYIDQLLVNEGRAKFIDG